MINYRKIILLPAFILLITAVSAQYTQWRGPERNGHYPDKGLLQEWPEEGPKLILKVDGLNNGYSSPVYYKNNIYIPGRKDSLTMLTAINMDGKVLWETAYGKAWDMSYQETRNTPTIEDDRIYIGAGLGDISCIDANTGKLIWSVNTHENFKGEFHRWGYAESLLLTDNAVISSPAGTETVMVALDKKTGQLIWKTEPIGDVRSYVSPLLINHNGRKLIISVTSGNALGIDPLNGRILWKYDLLRHAQKGRRNNTNTPLYHQGEIFLTCGYDAEGIMLKLSDDGESASLKWKSDVLDTHHGGVVLVDGYIYGSNWINNGNGNWVCLDWDTGEVMYEEKWHNKGSIIYADKRLYLYEEKQGHVGLALPDPSGFMLKGSFRITDGVGPHWAHPAIFDSRLFIRHGEVLMVYDISDQSSK